MSDPTLERLRAARQFGWSSSRSLTSVLRAVDGLRDGRACAVLFGCIATGFVVAALLVPTVAPPGTFADFVSGVVYLLFVGTGINAAGALQMDDCRGNERRRAANVLAFGLACVSRLVVLCLALLAIALAVFAVLAIVLAIGKIPLLGPLVFALALPLSVVVAGATVTGLVACLVLALPALWQGDGVVRALARTFANAKRRLIETLLVLAVVGVVAFGAGFVVFGVLVAGLVPTMALSAAIVGSAHSGVDAIAGVGMADLGDHAFAGSIGMFVLWAAAGSWLAQVWLRGLALVSLRAGEGVDPSVAEAALRAAFDAAKRRAGAIGDRIGATFGTARKVNGRSAKNGAAGTLAASSTRPANLSFEMMQSAAFGGVPSLDAIRPGWSVWQPTVPMMEATPGLPGSSPSLVTSLPPSSSPSLACSYCQASVDPGDVFCGACGRRLSEARQ